MKYILIFSIVLNLWFQFRKEIFYKYVNYTYCPNSIYNSIQYSEYDILGLNLLHINFVVDPGIGYSTVSCEDGTDNKIKELLK